MKAQEASVGRLYGSIDTYRRDIAVRFDACVARTSGAAVHLKRPYRCARTTVNLNIELARATLTSWECDTTALKHPRPACSIDSVA
ncbi:hypothetical protein EVAR_46615_1 [Eumeta japonica]|uniref:Uncharacterized protein n=1 Tax=Eumeta variegata TaxID=151549 RepID=A0A4C1ZA00_EUMVA|nr:hypothetical protein EVAR_46615_1 [Eumeta japonica]